MLILLAALSVTQIPVAAATITNTVARSPRTEFAELPMLPPVSLQQTGFEKLDQVVHAVKSDMFVVPESDTATMILLGALLCGGGVFLKRRFQPATELESGIPGDNTSGDSPFRLER